jgi:hypothetical protein
MEPVDSFSNSFELHPSPSAKKIKFSKDISSLENAFSRKDFIKIIESPDLFWMAFCNALSQTESEDSEYFSTFVQGKTLTVAGEEYIISDVQKFLEEIRKLFVKAHTPKNSFFILPIKITSDYFVREKTDTVDLTDWLSDRVVKLYESWFISFIQPSMPILCKSIGATCSNIHISQKIITGDPFNIENKNVKAFKIDWINGEHFTYPIEPKRLSPRDDLQKSIYSMYEKHILCDLSIVAKDGIVKVHSIPLFTYGGDMIQKMLTCNMKESLEKVVSFKEFSLNSVKAFVDFMYLGENGLKPESVSKNDVDLYELFQMANTYQVQELIDCCTNLLSLFSSTEDVEKIKHLAEFYENEHLKELYENLLLKLNPSSFIKV